MLFALSLSPILKPNRQSRLLARTENSESKCDVAPKNQTTVDCLEFSSKPDHRLRNPGNNTGAPMNVIRPLLFWLFVSLSWSGLTAQSPGNEPSNSQELNFPMPATTGTIGTKDSAALEEISVYMQATGISGWNDLEGTGTLTYPKDDAHAATLYLSGSGSSRLDVKMDSGTRSLRISGNSGIFQDEKSHRSTLLTNTVSNGLVIFPRLWANVLAASVSLFDHGIYTQAGEAFHRLTVEYPVFVGHYKSGDPTTATDLYFDPKTHLLLFSVDAITYMNSKGKYFNRLTKYSDYQPVEGAQLPMTIQQFLDGHQEWTLQLSQAAINTNTPLSTFSF